MIENQPNTKTSINTTPMLRLAASRLTATSTARARYASGSSTATETYEAMFGKKLMQRRRDLFAMIDKEHDNNEIGEKLKENIREIEVSSMEFAQFLNETDVFHNAAATIRESEQYKRYHAALNKVVGNEDRFGKKTEFGVVFSLKMDIQAHDLETGEKKLM